MKTEVDMKFVERVSRSWRGDMSASEREELKLQIESDQVKRAESEQLIVTHELFSLCAATDAPPSDVPLEALRLLRLEVGKHIKRKPAKWRFGPTSALWTTGIAAALILGIVMLDAPPSSTTGLPLEYKPHLDYRLQSKRSRSDNVARFMRTESDEAEPFHSVLRRVLDGTVVEAIEPKDLPDWEGTWPDSSMQPAFKILIYEFGIFEFYKSDLGQVKVMGRWRGATFQKTFQITTSEGLPKALVEAQDFIEETIRQHDKQQ